MYIFGGTVDNNVRSSELYRFQVNSQILLNCFVFRSLIHVEINLLHLSLVG